MIVGKKKAGSMKKKESKDGMKIQSKVNRYKETEKRTGKRWNKNSDEFYAAIMIDKIPTALFYLEFRRR